MELYMLLKNGGPLCQKSAEREGAMIFEDADDAFDVLLTTGVEEGIVASLDPPVIVERLRSGGFEWVFYTPDDQAPRFVTLDEFDAAFNPSPERREKLRREEAVAIARRMMMEMAAEGWVEWDLDTDTYRTILPEERAKR